MKMPVGVIHAGAMFILVTIMATDTTASAVVDDLHSNVDAATTMVMSMMTKAIQVIHDGVVTLVVKILIGDPHDGAVTIMMTTAIMVTSRRMKTMTEMTLTIRARTVQAGDVTYMMKMTVGFVHAGAVTIMVTMESMAVMMKITTSIVMMRTTTMRTPMRKTKRITIRMMRTMRKRTKRITIVMITMTKRTKTITIAMRTRRTTKIRKTMRTKTMITIRKRTKTITIAMRTRRTTKIR